MRSASFKPWLPGALAVATACQRLQPTSSQPAVVQAPTGVYVGLAEMKGMPAEKPGDKWYHENIVYIRPDSLYLEGNPIVVSCGGEKSYSASDGGFYAYRGRLDTNSGRFVAKLSWFSHGYPVPITLIEDSVATANPTLSLNELARSGLITRDSSLNKKTFPISLTAKGFIMDSVRYVRLPADSLTNVFPVGFPDSKRFFGKAAKRYGR